MRSIALGVAAAVVAATAASSAARVSPSAHEVAATPLTDVARCRTVVRTVRGKKRRVRVCPKPAGPQWDYVALGDSIPRGTGSTTSFVTIFGRLVAQDARIRVKVKNLSRNGATSGEVLGAVRRDRSVRGALAAAEVITISLGLNDFGGNVESFVDGECGGIDNEECYRSSLRRFTANWTALVREVVRLRPPSRAIIRVTTDYNFWVGNPRAQEDFGARYSAVVAVTKRYIEALSREKCAISGAAGIPCADVYATFNGRDGMESPFAKGLMAPDRIHPSARGHGVIAGLLRGLGYAPLG